MMEMVSVILCYLVLLIVLLVSVAFVTLVEQKILGSIQVRVGPNSVGYWGLLQPFADAVKLFSKEGLTTRVVNFSVFYVSPVASLSLALMLWSLFPFMSGGFNFMYSILIFICISGMNVYPVLSSGWASNCKYSMLGSLRAVAQMVSYEVSLAVVLLSVVWVSGSFSLNEVMLGDKILWNFFFFFPLGVVWFVSSLAETNRSPYDFAEGESELVSGFNTEYMAGGFTLIFMAEYASIIFMSLIYVVIFMSASSVNFSSSLKLVLLVFMFVWVRGTLPRYRYDKLMGLAWKSFLPLSLMFFVYYLGLGMMFVWL